MNSHYEYSNAVKMAAGGQWPYILQSLAGADEQQTDARLKNKGTPCLNCGGNNRYSFKDAEDGSWGCRNCGGGDGWELLKRVCGWSFPEAIRAVGELLYIEPVNSSGSLQTERQQKAIEQAEKRRKAAAIKSEQESKKIAVMHQYRALYARQEWVSGVPADPNNPYLQSHCLPPFNLRQIQHLVYGLCLLVPMFNEHGELMNLERIFFERGNPKAQKRPIKDAQKKGCFYQFGTDSFTVYIAESWSTGAAIHLAKPCSPVVLAAMSAGNIDAVASIAKRRFPGSEIVIAADHDKAGIQAAIKAASNHDLKIVVPRGEGNDFCDLHIKESRGCRQ